MSIVCKEVEIPPYCKTTPRMPKYLQATIDPTTANQLPFPSDYKYFSCTLPTKYSQWIDRLQHFKIRKDDIWILGFPKSGKYFKFSWIFSQVFLFMLGENCKISGTTWTQNIVYQLKIQNMTFNEYFHPDNNFFDMPMVFEKVDGDAEFSKFVENMDKTIDELDALPSPRMIKSHLPAYLLPKEMWTVQPKMIYVSREVKDLAVSLFHMCSKCMRTFDGSASEFFHSIRNGYTIFAPYYEHIYSYKQLCHLKQLFLMTYEDLSSNTFEEIKRMCKFLDCSYSDEQLRKLVEHTSFGNMRKQIISVAKNDEFA